MASRYTLRKLALPVREDKFAKSISTGHKDSKYVMASRYTLRKLVLPAREDKFAKSISIDHKDSKRVMVIGRTSLRRVY